jgi:hypothetical protein
VEEPRQYENLNFATFAANQILMRIGWVFRTESVVILGFLDTYSTSDVVRGFLPVSFRLVQSLAQFFLAQHVAQTPFKQPLFTLSVFGIMVPWLVIAVVAGGTRLPSSVVVGLFLALYTLQGKLIRAERRGSLLVRANSVGSILAIAVACRFMYEWLGGETPRYSAVFGATAVCYGMAAIAKPVFSRTSLSAPTAATLLQIPRRRTTTIAVRSRFSQICRGRRTVLFKLAPFSTLHRFWIACVGSGIGSLRRLDCRSKLCGCCGLLDHWRYRRSPR